MDGAIPLQKPIKRSVCRTFCTTTLKLFGDPDCCCNLVLTKSSGWKRTVLQVPESEPAKKALRTGFVATSILSLSGVRLNPDEILGGCCNRAVRG